MSCGVGHRKGLDPELLWLWHRLAAAAPIQSLYGPKKQKKKKKKKKKKEGRKKERERKEKSLEPLL